MHIRGFAKRPTWLIVGLLACVGATTDSADPLASKGLTKQGVVYVLPVDATLPYLLRDFKAAQAKYDDTMHRRDRLETDVKSAKATLQKLAEQNQAETQKLQGINQAAYATYNKQVDLVNSIRANLREGVQFVKNKQQLLDEIDDPTDAYSAAVQDASQKMEAGATQYAALAKDPQVTAAIAQINVATKPPVHLGPSDRFTVELSKFRNLQKMLVSSTINFAVLGGTPHVPVVVGDTKLVMAIDSGATYVTLNSKAAQKAGVAVKKTDKIAKLVTADGTILEAHLVVLPSVRVGAFTVENVDAAVLPDDAKANDCLLGGSFLKHFIYKMDLSDSTIRLTQIPDPKAAVTTRPVAAKQ